jgi:hypothetical protein
MFTDNSTTVQSCAYKGLSTSPKLLSLIVRLRALGTKHGIKIHIFHVAGTRIIAQGMDGVSRGYLALGIMAGKAMCSFIPIHQTACECSPKLVEWIKVWSGSNSIVLYLMGWFEKGHDIVGWNKGIDGFERPIISSKKTYIWSPPPFAAKFTLAEMRKSQIVATPQHAKNVRNGEEIARCAWRLGNGWKGSSAPISDTVSSVTNRARGCGAASVILRKTSLSFSSPTRCNY